jgi:predicted transcriptional regulator
MIVRDWMTADVAIVAPSQTLSEALEIMERARIRRLPVVSDGRLVGIVTRNDINRMLGRPGAAHAPVDMIMARNPRTVEPSEPLELAAVRMIDNRVSGLPVVQDGQVVGMITRSDLLMALARFLGYGQLGARVSLRLAGERPLERLVRRFGHLTIGSLVICPLAGKKRWSILARVRGRRIGSRDAEAPSEERSPEVSEPA